MEHHAESRVFGESRGQVKVTIKTISEFNYDQLVIARVYLLDETNPEQACGESTPKPVIGGEVSVLQKFVFDYGGERFLRCEIANQQDDELGHGDARLDTLLTVGEDRRMVELSPQGRMEIEMTWDEAPKIQPTRIRLSDLAIEGVSSTADVARRIDPYIQVKVATNTEEREIGKTGVLEGHGGTADFSHDILEGPYAGESELIFTVWDRDKLSGDDRVGEAVFDLWQHIKEKGTENSPVGKLRLDTTGHVLFSVRVYTPEEDNRISTPRPLETSISHFPEAAITPREEEDRGSSVRPSTGVYFADDIAKDQSAHSSSSSDTSTSSSSGYRGPDNAALQKALKDAERAAEAAEADAQRAKGVLDLIKDVHPKDADGADAAHQAREAASAAANRAAAARKIADDLAHHPPHSQADLDQAVRDAMKAAYDARSSHDKANQRAKEAAAVSAREYAKAARESAREAASFADETRNIAAQYPTGPKVRPLQTYAVEATNASQEADQAAADANQLAKNAEASSSLHDALKAVKRARENAAKAKEQERIAEDRWREASKRARMIDRAREEEAQRQAAKEAEARRQATQRQEEARNAEHEAEKQRRLEQLISPGDASEPAVYKGVTAYSFHNPNPVDDFPVSNFDHGANRFNFCCAPSKPQPEVIVTRKGSVDSLTIKPPTHEIRGDGIQHNSYPPISQFAAGHVQIVEQNGVGYDEDTLHESGHLPKTGVNYSHPLPPTQRASTCIPLLEGDGLVETLIMKRRPQCWCFGCGCMRCCGEC